MFFFMELPSIGKYPNAGMVNHLSDMYDAVTIYSECHIVASEGDFY